MGEELVRALGEALPGFLPRQRWFGEKGRVLRSVSVADVAEADLAGERLWLAVVDLAFEDGDGARYFVPLTTPGTTSPDAGETALLDGPAGTVGLTDAFASAGFLRWVIAQIADEAVVAAGNGHFEWNASVEGDDRLAAAREATPSLSAAEQSNSSVRYGDALFVKVFRRLRAGTNPEEEMVRFLATRTSFRRVPEPLGWAAYRSEDGAVYPLALAQAFVPNVGDGWGFTLGHLVTGDDGSLATAAGDLGERTAQLHAALASVIDDPAFAPEPITTADAAGWATALVASLRRADEALRRRSGELTEAQRARVTELGARLPDLERRAAGFGLLEGWPKTRVHGDYHLGQTLRTPDADWVVIDFEGEPARTIEERRAKTSPLKDVAGMLRSFSYARSAAWQGAGAAMRQARFRAALERWEADARTAFLSRYAAEAGRSAEPLVPLDEERFSQAVAAWELDKAVYELFYELNNRPGWLDHALSTLLD